jgi:hypothetical protein
MIHADSAQRKKPCNVFSMTNMARGLLNSYGLFSIVERSPIVAFARNFSSAVYATSQFPENPVSSGNLMMEVCCKLPLKPILYSQVLRHDAALSLNRSMLEVETEFRDRQGLKAHKYVY